MRSPHDPRRGLWSARCSETGTAGAGGGSGKPTGGNTGRAPRADLTGIKVPVKHPADGQVLAADNLAYNTLHRATRCLGERGFALLTGRWRALQRITVNPSRIGELAQAALVLTRIENIQLRTSC